MNELTTTPTSRAVEPSPFPIQHDIDRLKKLGRFGGERFECLEFSDGEEYRNTLERVVLHFLSQSQPTESQCRGFVEKCFSRFQDCLVSESTTDIFGDQTKAALTAELSRLAGRSQGWPIPSPDAA